MVAPSTSNLCAPPRTRYFYSLTGQFVYYFTSYYFKRYTQIPSPLVTFLFEPGGFF